MSNPYDLGESNQAPRPAPSTDARRGSLRPALWIALVACAAANIVTSSVGINVLVGIGFGLLTLACIVALVVDHYAHRAR